MKSYIWPYLAGIFDGEGSIALNSRRPEGQVYDSFFCHVVLYNTSLPLMKWLVKNFGGVYYTRHAASLQAPAKLTQYVWHPSGKKNKIKLLLGMLPYSVIKHSQMKCALEYLHLGYGEAEKRHELVRRNKLLNQGAQSLETNTPDPIDPSLVMIESDLIGDDEREPDVNPVYATLADCVAT